MVSESGQEILDGKYELLEQLGSGGMGEIFLVRHLHLDQKRVVKILRKELVFDPASQQRFLREARLATSVKHPNVAILYDYAQLPDQSFYMVWEYIDGLDVGQLMQRDGAFSLRQALLLAIQALRGLEAIHASGVIHRDISPDNLMVTRDNRNRPLVKIIDLGLAKGHPGTDRAGTGRDEVTQAGMFLGKLRYCSPEQATMDEAQPLDLRTDIYSFGLVLYEMLSGVEPFEADSPAAAIFKRLSEDPIPLSDRATRNEIPPALNAAVLRALERDPQRRFPDAISFIEALEPVAQGLAHLSTQRIPITEAEPRKASQPARATEPPKAPRTASVSRISREERSDLLAQIERAAQRVKETSKLLGVAEEALTAGDLERARRLRAKLTEANPRAPGLADFTVRLMAAEEQRHQSKEAAASPAAEPPAAEPETSLGESSAAPPSSFPGREEASPRESGEPGEPAVDRQRQLRAAEQMLEGYLRAGKRNLAELALETLLEMAPEHPKKEEYQSWIRMAGDEEAQRRKVHASVEEARKALQQQDLKAARRHLSAAERINPDAHVVASLEEEVEAAETARDQGKAFEALNQRFQASLGRGDLKDARQALEEMASLGLSKVAQTYFLTQLEEAELGSQERRDATPYVKRLEDCLEWEDFKGARSAVHELSEALPASRLPAQLQARIDEAEQAHRRRRSIEQGIQQVEGFLDSNNPQGAALGLKILKQMAPDDSRWKGLEKRLDSLRP